MKSYVVGFLFSTDKQWVALMEKDRPAWQKGLLNGLGGKIRKDETPGEAMYREFNEEGGLLVSDWRLFFILRSDPQIQDATGLDIEPWEVHFFMAMSEDVGLVRTMESERVAVYSVKRLPELKTIPNLSWLIPLAMDKDKVTAQGDEHGD